MAAQKGVSCASVLLELQLSDLEQNQDVSGAMCRRKKGAGNKNQEPCRDFQELRLEGTEER